MQITYVLELLKPSKNKQKIIEDNIKASLLNRVSIFQKLLTDNNKLSSKDFIVKEDLKKYKKHKLKKYNKIRYYVFL